MFVKEELLAYLLQGYIHVSKKDFHFFSNLKRFIEDGKKITSKQDELFTKLLTKYQRQLKKNKFELEFLLKLKWQVEVVPTDPALLIPKISMVNEKLIVRAPYNKKFAGIYRGHEHFTWDKITKSYFADFTTLNFKTVLNNTKLCFGEYKLCSELERVVDGIREYANLIWEPTLIQSNGTYYVVAINEQLYEQLINIPNDYSLSSFYKLSQLGIQIGSNILVDDLYRKFFNNYEMSTDLAGAEKLLLSIQDLGIEKVYVAGSSNAFLQVSSNLITNKIKELNINFEVITRHSLLEGKKKVNNAVTFKFSKSMMMNTNIVTDKVIFVANDTPIDIK